MKNFFKGISALGLALLFTVLTVSSASASPTGVSFTQDKVYVAPGEVVTYTPSASIVCDIPPCNYQWRVFGKGWARTGTLWATGNAPQIARWGAGNQLVQLKVTNSGGTNGFQTYDAYTVVK